MTAPTALFRFEGDHYDPTELTRSGWAVDVQHGGPPAGLLAHALESVPVEPDMRLVRLTIDLMRRVPIAPLTATTEVVRSGRRIQVLNASLTAGGIEVARATGLRIRTTSLDLPYLPSPDSPAMPSPARTAPVDPPLWETGGPDLLWFHRHGVEIRTVGNSFWSPGRGLSWLRLRVPVVEGVALTPLTRVAALSDVGNGNARLLDPEEWQFVNPDITVALHRDAEGEWIGMDSSAHQHPAGIGMADTLLFDEQGAVGRVIQTQLIEPR